MGAAVEIAVQDAAGARIAMDGGADRIELCQALGVGGLTPSLGTIAAVIEAVGGERVNVLVRPRPGGFVYDAAEVAVVVDDIAAALHAGAGGIVVGALTADGEADLAALRRWRDAAAGAVLVFHRAIDAAGDPVRLLGQLQDAGVDRVLTSGGAARSIDGVATLTAMALASAQRGGDIEITAGGGIRISDIPAILAAGVDAVHLSARTASGAVFPSGPGGGAAGYDVTDPALVRAAVAAARA